MTHNQHLLPALLLVLSGLAPALAYVDVSGNVSGQHWTAGTYHVIGDLMVDDDASLNLDPGVVVKFEADVILFAYGTVNAPGVSGTPIVFTSRNDNNWGDTISGSSGAPAAGDWDGLYLYGYSSTEGVANLAWTVIAWAGGPGNPASAGIYCYYSDALDLDHCTVSNHTGSGVYTDQSSPAATNSIFTGNGGHGLYCSGGTPVFQDNICNNNGGWGAYLTAVGLRSYTGNIGLGNGGNGILLQGDANQDCTWHTPDPGFPLVLSGTSSILDGLSLTLAPGTVIKADSQAQLLIYGSLNSPGTAGQPVRLVSLRDDSVGGDTAGDGPTSGAPGDWLGIQAYGYSSYDGILDLDYTVLRHGGGNGAGQGGLYLYYADTATLDHCTVGQCSASGLQAYGCNPVLTGCILEGNLDHGLYADAGSVPVLVDNQFNQNQDYGAYLDNVSLTGYSGNTGSGNGINGLGLSGTVNSSLSWEQPDPAFPFILTGTVSVADDVTLSLPPGMLVKAGDQVTLIVYGSLDCPGTASQPIRFVSLKDDSEGGDTNGDGPSTGSPGDWLGIHAYGYSSYDGILDLEYTELRHGGGSGAGQGGLYLYYADAVALDHCTVGLCSASGVTSYGTSPVLTACILEDNLDHGLYADAGSTPVLVDNQFNQNQDSGAYLDGVNLISYSGNTGTGNGINGLSLSGTMYTSSFWNQPDPTFPFVLNGPVTISDDVTLTLPAGTLVKAANQVQLLVYGSLACPGTAVQPVRFVSLKDDSVGGDTNGDGPSSGSPGDWLGIMAYGYSSSEGSLDLDYTELHHGGGSGAGQGGLYLLYCDSATLDNCTVGHCSASGLQSQECSPVLTASAFVGNLVHGLHVSGTSAPQLTNNQFLGNQGWGARLDYVTLTGYSGNGGSGNGIDGLGLSGTVYANVTVGSSPGFPFVLTGDLTVADDYTLNLAPGTVFKGEQTGRLLVYGTLLASGSAETPVWLTSLSDDSVDGDTGGDGIQTPQAGDWAGLYLYGYSSSEGSAVLNWCYVDHAGYGQAAVYAAYSDALSISNSRILHAAGNGLQAENCSFSLGHSVIALNQGYGVMHNGYTANLGSCSGGGGGNCFLFNSGYALYNNTASPIEACGNFWGSTDSAVIDGMIYDDEENAGIGAVDFSAFSTTGCSPVITSITVVDGMVTLQWLPVPGASGYRIESSTAAWSGFANDTSGIIAGFTWMAPQPLANTNYRVVALFD